MLRKASHSGSWYSDDPIALAQSLETWIQAATQQDISGKVRAIIAPHAGYAYSGETAAFAYADLDVVDTRVKNIFLLGPSHHLHLRGCALTASTAYNTPLGDLTVDTQVNAELMKSNEFEIMSSSVDEEEHSLEMQMPFIAHLLSKLDKLHSVKIVPILVGHLSDSAQDLYGAILSTYFKAAENLVVVSSDFCHWGRRFGYVYKPEPSMPIHAQISTLDHMGMACIAEMDLEKFRDYLATTENTVCGRYPICVLMAALKNQPNVSVTFKHYAQSSAVVNMSQSSVSYAAAVITWDVK